MELVGTRLTPIADEDVIEPDMPHDGLSDSNDRDDEYEPGMPE